MALERSEDPREELFEADRLVDWSTAGVPIIPPYAWYRLGRAAVLALLKITRDGRF